MHEIANEIAKLEQRDWFDWVSLIISILIPIAVLYIQRFFDNSSKEEEMRPHLALGPFESSNQTFILGNFYNTDLSIIDNPLQKSQIRVPLYNIGGSPVSNIVVKYTIQDFDKLAINKPQQALQQTDKDQIYLHSGTQDKSPKYTLLKHVNGQKKLKYVYTDNGERKVDTVFGYNQSTFNAKSSGHISVPPLISNQQQTIPMDANFELFVQFILFMNDIRLLNLSPEIPNIQFDVSYTDYKGNRIQTPLMMSLVAFELHDIDSTESTELKLSWSLQPKDII